MLKILLTVLMIAPMVKADDLLEVLDGERGSTEGLVIEKKSTIFKGLVSQPTAEQTIFFQFLEKGEVKKALYQWASAFEGTSFERSDSGRALYGYLLFKNGLEITGIESLFMANPKGVNKKLIRLWQGLMQTNEALWKLTDVKWSAAWTDVFGISAEVMVTARRFDSEPSIAELESLLRRTTSNTWERSWTEWRYITTLLMQDEIVKAAKLLKHLQGVKQGNPVSENLMNLTAARMLYQKGYLNQAIRYYKKVEKGTDYWFEALEEMGWAQLRLGRPQDTLAYTQTLLVDDFQADVGPETFYLASLANLKVCDYAEVAKVLKTFRQRFRSKAAKLLALKEKPETTATKKLFSTLAKGRTTMTALGASGTELPRYSTRDENLFYLVQREDKMSEEANKAKELYSRSLSEGTAQVGFQAKMEKFRNAIQGRARNSYTAALNRMKELAKNEVNEISEVLKKMQIVEAELIQQLALSERVIKDSQQTQAKVKTGSTGSEARDTLTFPFNGEIWFDELNNYKIDIAGGCQAGKGKTL